MTPDSESPDSVDRIARPSRRAVVLGALGVLAAGGVVAAAGFLAAGTAPHTAPEAGSGAGTPNSQLGTLPLHDEKPMNAVGKGIETP